MKIVFQEVLQGEHPAFLVFVEVENNSGYSQNWGTWQKHQDGEHDALVIGADSLVAALGDELLELDHRNALEALLAQQTKPRSWQRLTDDERNVLAEYRELRASVGDGKSLTMSLRMVDGYGHVIRCEDKEPVPDLVYYRDGNFYDFGSRIGRGEAFYYKWRDRSGEFPTFHDYATIVTAAKAGVDPSGNPITSERRMAILSHLPKTIMGSDGRDHPI